MQGIPVLRLSELGLLNITAIRFIDNNSVSELHDTSFDALQFVSCTRNLKKHEEIHHGVYCSLRLPDTNRFHKYSVEPGSFAQDDCFPGFTGNAT